jgi:hypothetical protein
MDKIIVTKTVAKHVVAWSTSFAVGNIVRNNVVPTNNLQKVEVQVAAWVLGYMVAEHAETAVCKMIDGCVDAFNKVKTNLNEAK